MGRRKKGGIPGVSFSLNRALGITQAKQKISRQIGIPLTKQGRQRKAGAIMGFSIFLAAFAFVQIVIAIVKY
jgi:hypothetical protein